MKERKAHCIISFDKTCPETCKLYDNAVMAYDDAIYFLEEIGMSREDALKFYWKRSPQEKVTIEAERAQYLKNQGAFALCENSDIFFGKGMKMG